MATLKGQNFRICTYDTTAGKYKVVGMATGCTVTLTNNTDDASTKDDVGMASKPTTTSKSWQVSCESLSVADTAAMLLAIKSLTQFTLMWDETSTSDNQTREKATFARKGTAYLSDVTFNFNDRENATKSLQFSGSGTLQTVGSSEATDVIALGSYTKGQFVRLFLGSDNTAAPSTVIAAAKSLSLHVSLTLEDATTKDTVGEWQVQEPTALSYDISTGALVRSGETITSQVGAKSLADLETIYEAGTPVKWKIANVGGDNNRTASSTIISGSVVLQTLTVNGPNRANADYTAQLVGYGEYSFESQGGNGGSDAPEDE
jgi:predicted secreted protein